MDDFYLELLNQTGLACITDPLGNISWVNDNFSKASGFNRSELLEKNISLLKPEWKGGDLAREIAKNDLAQRYWRGEIRYTSKSGRHYWVDSIASIKAKPDGTVAHYYFQFDITDKKLAEENLHFSHTNFQLLFENTQDIVAVIDSEGTYKYLSPSASRLSGYQTEELVGKKAFDFFHPDDIEHMRVHSLVPALEGKETSVEFRFRTKDGTYLWFEANTKTIFDPQTGAISGICTFSRDITEKKKDKQSLTASMELYHSLVNNLPLSVWRKDSVGRLTYVNKTLVETIKLSEKELLGKTNYDLYSKEDADKYALDDAFVLQSGLPYKGTELNIHPVTKEKSYLETIKIPIRNADGKIDGLQGVFWDVTEVVNATEKILRSQRHFKKLVNRIHEIILLSDKTGRIMYCSESSDAILGYSSDAVVSKKLYELFPEYEHQGIREVFNRASYVSGSLVSTELRIRNKKGELRWAELSLCNYSDDVDIKAIIVNIKDIHAQKKAAENIRYQANLLQEVSDAIISTDENFRVVSWNKAAEKTYGYSQEEATDKTMEELVATEYPSHTVEAVSQALAETGVWEGEVIQTSKSGLRLHMLSSVSAIKDEFGKPIGSIAVNRNITDWKEAEKTLRLQNEQLTEIAWLHSHKVRGPVATIMGLMNIYNWSNPQAKESVDIIKKVDQVIRQLDIIIHDVVRKTGELYQIKKPE